MRWRARKAISSFTKTNELFKEWGAASPYKGVYNAVYMHRDPDTGLFYMPPVEADDESGLIPSPRAARGLLDALARKIPREELEIIWARHWNIDRQTTDLPAGLQFIGYDVAEAGADFFSLCGDEHFEFGLDEFASLLNRYRLFDSADEARNYLDAYLAMGLDKVPPCVASPVVWEIYLVDGLTE